eukprot:gene41888-56729_t
MVSVPTSAEKDNGATINYDNDKDEYSMSFDDDTTYIPLTFTRVVGGLLKYSKREVKRADEAMKLRRRLSFPAVETITKHQTIINILTTRKDLVRSVDIYGKDRNSIRGKGTKRKTKTIYMELVYKPSEVEQHMNIDIFFIEGEGCLISVLIPLDYVMITRIKNRTSEALRAARSVPSPCNSGERRLHNHPYPMRWRKGV